MVEDEDAVNDLVFEGVGSLDRDDVAVDVWDRLRVTVAEIVTVAEAVREAVFVAESEANRDFVALLDRVADLLRVCVADKLAERLADVEVVCEAVRETEADGVTAFEIVSEDEGVCDLVEEVVLVFVDVGVSVLVGEEVGTLVLV